jgi:hypothetical protein
MKSTILLAVAILGLLNSCQKDNVSDTIFCFSNKITLTQGSQIYIDQVLGKSCVATYAYSVALHDENEVVTRAYFTSDIKYQTRKDKLIVVDSLKHEAIYLNEQ